MGYISAADAAHETIWLIKLLDDSTKIVDSNVCGQPNLNKNGPVAKIHIQV